MATPCCGGQVPERPLPKFWAILGAPIFGEKSVQLGPIFDVCPKRDQALAGLFYRSGWTQQELAEVEGKSGTWMSDRLRFRRFLEFSASAELLKPLPKNLTEGNFRGYWKRTDKTETNERIRFRAVQRLMGRQMA